MNNNKIVWIYWENPPGLDVPPPHIRLCRELMYKRCRKCSVRLVTPENLQEYLPDLPPEVEDISIVRNGKLEKNIAMKAAFIRAFLIEKYGGAYFDSDCILLRDPYFIFELLDKWDFAVMRRTSAPKKHISIGFYASRAGGAVISEYASMLRASLSRRTVYNWGDPGAWTITPIVDQYRENVYEVPEEKLHPIVAERKRDFLKPSREIFPYLRHNPIAFMLFHRLFELEETRNSGENELMAGDTVLSEAFRLAASPWRRRVAIARSWLHR